MKRSTEIKPNRLKLSIIQIYEAMTDEEQMAVDAIVGFAVNEERKRIIKELEKETVIGADCFGEGFECIPKWKAIEIVKRGWLEEE